MNNIKSRIRKSPYATFHLVKVHSGYMRNSLLTVHCSPLTIHCLLLLPLISYAIDSGSDGLLVA